MNKSRSVILVVVAFVLLVIVVVWARGGSGRRISYQNRGLRIATVLPLTGEFAKEGELARKVFAFSAEEYNLTAEEKIKLVNFDGKYAPKDTLMAYSAAMAQNPDAIIVYGDVPCNCLAKSISAGQSPVIAIAADNDIPYKSDKIFRGWVSTRLENRALAGFITRDLGAKNVAILYLRNNFGEVARNNFKEELLLRQGKIVAEESFDSNDQNMRAQIAKIVSRNPQVVYVIGFGLSFSSAINQIYETGYTGKLCSNTIVAVPSVNEHIMKRGEGIYFIDTLFDSEDKTEPVNSFVKRFKDTVGEKPTSFGVFEFEIVRILAEAANRSPKTDRGRIVEGLRKINNMQTLMGNFSYDGNGEVTLTLQPKRMKADGTYMSALE